MRHLSGFWRRMIERLDAGADEYHTTPAHQRPIYGLLAELEEEMVDAACWAYLAWSRLRGINVDSDLGKRIDRELDAEFVRAVRERLGEGDLPEQLGDAEGKTEGGA